MNLFGETLSTFLFTSPDVDYAVRIDAADEWKAIGAASKLGIPVEWPFYTNGANPKVSDKRVISTSEYLELKG